MLMYHQITDDYQTVKWHCKLNLPRTFFFMQHQHADASSLNKQVLHYRFCSFCCCCCCFFNRASVRLGENR